MGLGQIITQVKTEIAEAETNLLSGHEDTANARLRIAGDIIKGYFNNSEDNADPEQPAEQVKNDGPDGTNERTM